MRQRTWKAWWWGAWAMLLLASAGAVAQSRVFYAGGSGKERFHDVHALSDGTWLVAGSAQDLAWLPSGTPVTQIGAAGINSSAAGQVGLLLHLSADLGSVLRVVRLPTGTVVNLARIRSTEVPGAPTGVL
ncbi:MAG: hypothetical protein LW860_11935 [Xanthomonadaceae bacterium]|nr:hypothetical protein [Xanthomonadaceae bacterium]